MDRSTVDEGAIWASRFNVGLARSQKVLQSWLPAKPDVLNAEDEVEDDEDDTFTMGEAGGIGSKIPQTEDVSLDGLLKRRPQSSNDKLLEQLLGKKAAQAHRKSQQQQPVNKTWSQQQAGMKRSNPRAQTESHAESEDEEQGRAAAFSSRKSQKSKATSVARTQNENTADSKPLNHGEENEPGKEKVDKLEPPPVKKRAGNSYLDELLAQKARKKSKNKKHK